MKTTQTLTAALMSLAVLGSGCTQSPVNDPGRGGHTEAQREIDPVSYYENYESPDEEGDMAMAAPTAAGTAPQASDTGSELPRWPTKTQANTFVGVGLQGFVQTVRDRRSTFALDVDSGSFTVARTLLRSGHRPPPASIRPEEWVNAQEYDYAEPTDDLGVDVGHGTVAGDDRLNLLRVGVQARHVRPDDRPRVNVTLVVDVSGSMDIRERLGLVKSSLALLAKHLKPSDTVSVVTYDDQARPLLEPTPIRDTDTILNAIEDLQPGSSTNLEAGLTTGYRQARRNYADNAVNTVVLCSDGVANVGATSSDKLARLIQDGRNDGIHLVTVGFGMGNYNDDIMEQLANQGDGFYRYVDTFAEARRVFVRDLTGTLTPVADEAKAQVSFDPERVTSYRLIGYDNRAIADQEFTDPAVDAGEIGAGQSATALYELELSDGVRAGQKIGSAKLRWVDRAGHEQSTSVALTAPDGNAGADQDTALASVAADLAQVLKDGRVTGSRDVDVDSVLDRARALAGRGVPGARDLVRLAEQAARAE